ncbi:hypothetical protein ACSQ67_009657 [Phaseolus vulgaris]
MRTTTISGQVINVIDTPVISSLCGNRKLLFNNRINDENKRLEQNQQLLNLVDSTIEQNGGQPFTNELFKRLKERATTNRKAETLRIKRRLRRRYENELKQMTIMIQSKLEEELGKLKIMFEEERAARVNVEKNTNHSKFHQNKKFKGLKWIFKRQIVVHVPFSNFTN